MRTLSYLFGLGALLPALGFAAPAPHPTPPSNLDARAPGCDPTYTKADFKLDFEDLSQFCYMGPCEVNQFNLTTPRGQGYAYGKYNVIQKPFLLGNAYQWQGINCSWTGFAGKDESHACANNSMKALYSPGKSPYDPKLKPRLGTVDFPRDYITWAVKSFYITPIGLPAGTKSATLELKGIKQDGSEVTYSTKLENTTKKKIFQVTQLDRKGFTQIKVLEFWVVAGGKGGYAFAIDDLLGTEYIPGPVPESCDPPTTTIDNGPCTPAPTKTTTWTANAEEFTSLSTVVPTPYKSLNWNGYVQVLSTTTLSYFYPPQVIPSKGKNFYSAYSPMVISANTYEARFGVQSLSVACQFWAWAEPDYGETNGAPCRITFVGRRDPFDGDGLASRVVATYSIPNPGNVTSQKFTDIDLTKLTNDPGKFNRLYQFNIYTELGKYNYSTNILVDNVVFTRSIPKGEADCRMPGANTLNFDDISVGSSPVPLPPDYKGFKIDPPLNVISKKNYAKGTPGYIAPVSPNNAIWSGGANPLFLGGGVDTYISPVKNSLWTFESATFTLDLPEYATNKSIINDVQFSIQVQDACGYGGGTYYDPVLIERNQYFYYKTLKSDKLQFTFAEPMVGISKLLFSAYLQSGDYRKIEIFMDDLKYRKYTGPTPGCWRCGFRGGDWCEVPKIRGR